MAKKKKYENIGYHLLKLSLAFESYEDDGQDTSMPLYEEIINDVNDYRTRYNELSPEEREKLASKLVDKYEKLLDIVGRNNFIFYDDGDVNYIWKNY